MGLSFVQANCGTCDYVEREETDVVLFSPGSASSDSSSSQVRGSNVSSDKNSANKAPKYWLDLKSYDTGNESIRDDLETRPEVELETGELWYQGQWIKDSQIRCGKGAERNSDGSVFQGHWSQGLKNGPGSYVEGTSGTVFTGYWKDDLMEGMGTVKWPDGREYEGQFKLGTINGQGTLTYPDGKTYAGQWKDNQMHGQGIFTWPDGRKFDGHFEHGKKMMQQPGRNSFPASDGKIHKTYSDPLGLSKLGNFTQFNGPSICHGF